MKRLSLLVFLFLLAGIAAAIARLPLSFVLDRANLPEQRISWSAAQGTVWDGRVSGLYYGTQPLGEVRLGLRATDLLRGQMSYDVDLNGPAARGTGIVDLKNSSMLHSREMNLEVSLSALNGLDARLRELGGRLDIRGADILFDRNGCRAASGTVRSDLVTHIAAAFGQSWPEIAGDLVCDNGWLVFSLTGAGPLGEEFVGQGRLGPGPGFMEARIDNAGEQLGYGLLLVGFVPDGAGYVYRRDGQQRQVAP